MVVAKAKVTLSRHIFKFVTHRLKIVFAIWWANWLMKEDKGVHIFYAISYLLVDDIQYHSILYTGDQCSPWACQPMVLILALMSNKPQKWNTNLRDQHLISNIVLIQVLQYYSDKWSGPFLFS